MFNRNYPLEQMAQNFFAREHEAMTSRKSEVTRQTYVERVRGIVAYFSQHQSDDGRIIDPYVHQEKQYSTPAYAASAAFLVNCSQEFSLLTSATRALDACLDDMIHHRAADGHSNFYTTMMVFAFEQLKAHVSEAQIVRWKDAFHQIEWKKVYLTSMNNWGIVSLAGEWMRNQAGLGPSVESVEFDNALDWHTELITEYGMYVDPHSPMAYDMFSRNYFLLMLLHGYDGRHQAVLRECLRRGTLTSLFVQSPAGEMPTGGRSAQHQWNEAQQALQFEHAARFYRDWGDEKIAGAFKRAAQLSLDSISRFVRPSGELYVVKNFADPMTRTGFEGYSFHSQYNLLSAYFLSLAWIAADDTILSTECPAEIGGFSVWIEPFFHKLFINVGGNYVQIQTRGEPIYNPTGIIRIQRADTYSLLGPADAAPMKLGKAIAYSLAWENESGVMRLAELDKSTDVEIDVRVQESSDNRVVVELEYRGSLRGVALIRRQLIVTSEVIVVSDEVIGEVDYLVEEIPFLLDDGDSKTNVELLSHRINVSKGRTRMTVMSLDPEARPLTIQHASPFRNGLLGMATYRTDQNRTVYMIALRAEDLFYSDDELFSLYERAKCGAGCV